MPCHAEACPAIRAACAATDNNTDTAPLPAFRAVAGADDKALQDQYAAAMTDLTARAVHCCYGGHWPSRLGGIAALDTLVPRLPAEALPRLAPMIAKAVFAVLRILPERAQEEQQLSSLLRAVLARCGAAAPNAAPQEPGAAAAAGGADADTTPAAAAGGGSPAGPPAAGDEPMPDAPAPGSDGKADGAQLPPLLKQLMEIFVQHLLSSRSSMAVRGVASVGLEVG